MSVSRQIQTNRAELGEIGSQSTCRHILRLGALWIEASANASRPVAMCGPGRRQPFDVKIV
jgi:hypothetical protein